MKNEQVINRIATIAGRIAYLQYLISCDPKFNKNRQLGEALAKAKREMIYAGKIAE